MNAVGGFFFVPRALFASLGPRRPVSPLGAPSGISCMEMTIGTAQRAYRLLLFPRPHPPARPISGI